MCVVPWACSREGGQLLRWSTWRSSTFGQSTDDKRCRYDASCRPKWLVRLGRVEYRYTGQVTAVLYIYDLGMTGRVSRADDDVEV
jgi:hypothetical protein